MEPKIVKFGPVRIAGYLHKTSHSNNTIPAFWGEIMADGRHKKLHEAGFEKCHSEYGISFMVNENDMDYVIGVEIKEGAQVPEEFYVCEIPEGEYAVFSVPFCSADDPSVDIQKTWGEVSEWLDTSEYTHNDAASFELYFPGCTCDTDTECTVCNSGKMVCDIYISVDKK